MSVLVTGGAGYIGSHMVLALLDAGEQPVILDDLSTGFLAAAPQSVPVHVGDIGDAQLVAQIIQRHGVDAVIHFAARTVVPDSVADPLAYYENNTSKARTLIDVLARTGVRRVIFSSTAAVYGQPTSNPVREDAPLHPISPYGRSKLMVEWMLDDVSAATDLRYVALRYFNVAGADPQGRAGQSTAAATHLIKVAVQAALGVRPTMAVFGTDYDTADGSCLRDYIQVSDLARAHLDALRYLRAGGDSLTCNAGYGRGYSVLEVLESVKRVSGLTFPIEYCARRPGDAASVIASNERIKRVLDWRPQFDDLDGIVAQALAWEKKLLANEKRGPVFP